MVSTFPVSQNTMFLNLMSKRCWLQEYSCAQCFASCEARVLPFCPADVVALWRRETRGMISQTVTYCFAETSLVASSKGLRKSMAWLIWDLSPSFKHKVFLPRRHSAVITACRCSYSLSSMYNTEFHRISTAWISLCSGNCNWICTSFSLSDALVRWWKNRMRAPHSRMDSKLSHNGVLHN